MKRDCWLECIGCGARFPVSPVLFGCTHCGASGRKIPVEVRYDYSAPLEPDASAPGLWRWRSLLPPVEKNGVTSLHEGNTPLIPLDGMWDGPRLYLKNETASPTWAWKDRCNCVSISMARELGFRKVAVVTTGNHGMAAAAYSAAAGLECVVFCHAETPPLQLAVIQAYGACVFRGGRREEMLTRLVRRGGWFPASIYCPRDGCANPFGVEGFKTIAFEVVEQLGRVPDAVFVPVGSGDGFYGIWKGFRELRQVGAITHTPRMYICQAAGANSYERAFQRNATRLVPLESVDTIALSIAENIGGDHALRAVYEAGGSVLSATDDEILAAMRVLARRGLALEPASAASLACANKVAAEAARDALWVAIGTGASIKWPDAQTRAFKAPETLPPDFADVEHMLNLEAMK